MAALVSLKGDPELRAIPVVLISIVSDKELGLALGAADFLTKPVDRTALAEVMRSQCRGHATGTVLVVEDDAPSRELTVRTLEKLGYIAKQTDNGRRALAWLEQNPAPLIILLDLLMPEMDGFEFLEHLRSRPEWQDIPVIVVTAKQLTSGERQSLTEMTRQIIAKGQSAHVELAKAVRQVLAARTEKPVAAAD